MTKVCCVYALCLQLICVYCLVRVIICRFYPCICLLCLVAHFIDAAIARCGNQRKAHLVICISMVWTHCLAYICMCIVQALWRIIALLYRGKFGHFELTNGNESNIWNTGVVVEYGYMFYFTFFLLCLSCWSWLCMCLIYNDFS